MQTLSASPSAWHMAAFAGVALPVLWALRKALRMPATQWRGLVAWQAAIGVLAAAGYFLRFDQPWRALPTVGLSVALAFWLASRAFPAPGGQWLRAAPAWMWVAIQSFRLPLELLLHDLYKSGVIGVQMTYAGLNFDIAVGLTAPLLAGFMAWPAAASRRWIRPCVIAWNPIGLVLLANIVSIAVLSIPFPFQRFLQGPPNLMVAHLPFVWLPTLLVPLALAAHIVSLRRCFQPTFGVKP